MLSKMCFYLSAVQLYLVLCFLGNCTSKAETTYELQRNAALSYEVCNEALTDCEDDDWDCMRRIYTCACTLRVKIRGNLHCLRMCASTCDTSYPCCVNETVACSREGYFKSCSDRPSKSIFLLASDIVLWIAVVLGITALAIVFWKICIKTTIYSPQSSLSIIQLPGSRSSMSSVERRVLVRMRDRPPRYTNSTGVAGSGGTSSGAGIASPDNVGGANPAACAPPAYDDVQSPNNNVILRRDCDLPPPYNVDVEAPAPAIAPGEVNAAFKQDEVVDDKDTMPENTNRLRRERDRERRYGILHI